MTTLDSFLSIVPTIPETPLYRGMRPRYLETEYANGSIDARAISAYREMN